ncbi:flavin-containing monooxygenase [Coccomyxa subellipsoidea C-169]|uniref:Flavin-containing monooxygenase n=1 Tax=Coccomyxa subellipsoidea (strain C-169) TaxID=574566 RepID=I0ZAE8_COCSC|nr:flavin-containing monooxygenase [Coccomyxa subellipsoidea C-169]EIE27617.1 flavin-containing monooxygenase [Coccomyxa subellipsoidea C-169]|eukprot:XP_005652161.1 flavin-containing monooxygenase [Coccomyxa subellipsoidea C-169]
MSDEERRNGPTPSCSDTKLPSKDHKITIEITTRAGNDALKQRACVIGAGKSGLIACKVLHERNIPFDCFEASSQVGGLWVLNSDSGLSASYESLRINTSKQMTSFHDFPMPKHYPTYPTRKEILEYLESYADHFGFRSHITFRTEDKATGHTLARLYTSVLVANGHHWHAAWPELPGSFTGTLMHSHEYRTPKVMEGKRVMVIGAGNSGMDIASEASQCGAAAVFLSCRRRVHVVPRYIFGAPSDSILPAWLGVTAPRRLMEKGVTCLIHISRGSQTSFKFPPPDFGLLRVHPTVSPGTGDILQLIKDGKVTVRPGIERIEDRTVHFTDGTKEDIDIIVCATGYNVSCPFLPPKVEVLKGDKPQLLLNVAHPRAPGIFFLGFVQAHGPMIPCVEGQMPWVCKTNSECVQGITELPGEAEMAAKIAEQHEFNRRNFTQVKRHALMVEFHRYLLQLRMARCPKGKGWLGRKLWKAKTFLVFCTGKTC